ncbi:hypothetical protein ACLIBH_00215 [Virgibacillus sp. W0430]|uniref:hypothetical protein n=1 Tax=Virgibacillus sp. W0430 TaxID=3391580 RepID=UPI003F48918F
MNTDAERGLMAVGSLLALIGFIALFFSASFGTSLAEQWLISQGGMSDSSIYESRISTYMYSFLVGGGILFAIGVSSIIIGYYKLLQIKANVSDRTR